MGAKSREGSESLATRLRHLVIGPSRSILDPAIFHKLALIPVLAWIGLGADGVSSSSYGPQEAFLALGPHQYLVSFVALGTALTVFIISYSYSRIIENFPGGGGGYIVATHTLGNRAGLVAGCALLVDYMLTIAVSIAACSVAVFSFVPPVFQPLRLPFAIMLVAFLIFVNLRGVKESVLLLAPIFIAFIVFHILLLGSGLLGQAGDIVPMIGQFGESFQGDLATIGLIGIFAIVFRAYSLGAGTYTGIEAVANGLPIMHEPRVQTGKRTMLYMALSLALLSTGLLFCYYLWNVRFVPGQTLNAVLAGSVFGGWPFGGWIAFATILTEAALLIVGAQTGFIDGPRVMANMAIDSWLPRRFASLSERFVMNDGIILMGGAAAILVLFTQASITALVVMYAINVFLNFSLSQSGMARFFYTNRAKIADWRKRMTIPLVGALLAIAILAITVFEKFGEGGWITLVITAGVIAVCYRIHGHYRTVDAGFHKFDDLMVNCPSVSREEIPPVDPKKRTAVQLVSTFNGFGLHTFFSIVQNFPDQYDNFVFVSIAVVDSGSFKGINEVNALLDSVRESCQKYVDLARCLGFAAECRTAIGTDVVDTGVDLCKDVSREFPSSTIFAGQIIFRHEHPFHRILHNETAFAIQRRLHYSGITTVILPVQAEK